MPLNHDAGQIHLDDAAWQLETLVDNYLDAFPDAQQSQILLAWTTLQAVLQDLAAPPDRPDGP